MPPTKGRPLAACGLLAPVVFTVAWVVAGLIQEGYSARREDISALAASTAKHPWVMMVGLVTTGLLVAVFAFGLHRAVRRGSIVGPALIMLCGLGIIALGILRNDCSTMTKACEARVEAGEVSWQHTTHDLVSVPVFAAAVVAPIALALRFHKDARWRLLAPFSAAAAPLLAILFTLGGIEATRPWSGVLQRVAVSAAFLWLEVAALRLLWLTLNVPRTHCAVCTSRTSRSCGRDSGNVSSP